MATSDLLLKDQSATPVGFAPETIDLGQNASGTTVKRPGFGLADGADLTQGAKADAAWDGAAASASVVAILKRLATTALSPILAAGTAIIGRVGIDQTTPGTTNKVSIGTDGAVALSAALPAGEAHLGEIGGNIGRFVWPFGPSTSITYTAGQAMSAPIEVTGMARLANGSGLIVGASLALAVANTVEVDLVVFSAAPIGAYTAGSTFTIAAADIAKVSKVLKLTDWTALGTSASLGEVVPAPKLYVCEDTTKTTSLWVVPVARGSIALASATDATLKMRAARN